MKIELLPNSGFVISDKEIHFGANRLKVREKLAYKFEENDSFMDMSEFFDGDKSFDVYQKRDIYQNINNEDDCFFLNYDKEEKLESIEIHNVKLLFLNNFELTFGSQIEDIVNTLKSLDKDLSEIDEGNFLFEKLKLSIANSVSCGGEGNGLSYVYFTNNIDHLIS